MDCKKEKNIKNSIDTIEVHAKKVQDNLKEINNVADKVKQFTNSEAMNWFMGFKV